jgi:hypothetical protein
MFYVLRLTRAVSERGEEPQAKLRHSSDGSPFCFGHAAKATLVARRTLLLFLPNTPRIGSEGGPK